MFICVRFPKWGRFAGKVKSLPHPLSWMGLPTPRGPSAPKCYFNNKYLECCVCSLLSFWADVLLDFWSPIAWICSASYYRRVFRFFCSCVVQYSLNSSCCWLCVTNVWRLCNVCMRDVHVVEIEQVISPFYIRVIGSIISESCFEMI